MKQIKQNLENLFNENYDFVKNQTLENVINDYIEETNQGYISMGITHYLQDQEVIELKEALKNKELKDAFENVKRFDIDEELIISDLISGIKKSLINIKESISSQKDKFNIQLIFIIHYQLLAAGFCCYGEGNYPILNEPDDFDYDYERAVYNETSFIDYSKVSSKLFSFDQVLENLELDNYILSTTFYECLAESYKYKIYLLLNKAFEKIGVEIFEEIEIKKPLYIYANEHNCPPINISVFN